MVLFEYPVTDRVLLHVRQTLVGSTAPTFTSAPSMKHAVLQVPAAQTWLLPHVEPSALFDHDVRLDDGTHRWHSYPDLTAFGWRKIPEM